MIKIKRIYEKPKKSDGFRILIDRLWPRGIKKNGVRIDLWIKDVAPTASLRGWFGHDPKRWPQFKTRYFNELNEKRQFIEIIQSKAKQKNITLLFAAKDEKHNNAAALKEYLENK